MDAATEPSRRRYSTVAVVAVALVVAALVGVATWCLIGPQTTSEDPTGDDLDYIWRTPEVDRNVELAVGVAATLAAVAVALLLLGSPRLRRSPTVAVVAVATGLGVVLGGAGRVATAGVIGANIGGGMAILATPPLVSAALVVIVLAARRVPRP